MTDISGREQTFDWSAENEEVTILFFWNDPCLPCVQEMLFLDQLSRRASDMDLTVRVLAVEAGGLDAAQAEAVMDKYRTLYPKPTFPILLDSATQLSEVFGREGFPTTFLVDGTGTVIDVVEGFSPDWEGEWTGKVEGLLPRAEGVLSAPAK